MLASAKVGLQSVAAGVRHALPGAGLADQAPGAALSAPAVTFGSMPTDRCGLSPPARSERAARHVIATSPLLLTKDSEADAAGLDSDRVMTRAKYIRRPHAMAAFAPLA
jgi:aryl carrier-like protein